MTALRPSGKVRIGEDLLDVVTEGEFIERGAPVVVFEISGNRVIVARKPPE
jgi:membrane-bound serine protease (ClpP class)